MVVEVVESVGFFLECRESKIEEICAFYKSIILCKNIGQSYFNILFKNIRLFYFFFIMKKYNVIFKMLFTCLRKILQSKKISGNSKVNLFKKIL